MSTEQERAPAGPIAAEVAAHDRWYHTMEIAPGVVTPGWFDLRPVLERLPWPEVEGRRCLDVGPYDGQLAFELERRGAREVVAADIASFADWDWPLRLRDSGPRNLERQGATRPGAGFEIAKRALSSAVERVETSVYELTPERLGTFDVVTCGSLLLHLRDPVRALEAIRGVCAGELLSAEQIDPGLTLRHRKRRVARYRAGDRCQWWIPNLAAYRALLTSGGFRVERASEPYAIPLGPGHGDRGRRPLRGLPSRLAQRRLTGGDGVAHAAALCGPAEIGGAA